MVIVITGVTGCMWVGAFYHCVLCGILFLDELILLFVMVFVSLDYVCTNVDYKVDFMCVSCFA